MIKAITDFPLFNDDKELIKYKSGDVVEVRDQALVKKLILSGKCELHDPRKKAEPVKKKIVENYEKKIVQSDKKKKKSK